MSTESDIEALDAVCQRLSAFEEGVSLEWLDGYLTAVSGSRRRIEPDEWLARLGGGVFTRTFADPDDAGPARTVLVNRWEILMQQLDPEQVLEDPDVLRLAPLMVELTEEDKQQLIAEGQVPADQLHLLEQTGEVWALGYLEATRDFPEDWPEPDMETEEGQLLDEALMRIVTLTLTPEELEEVYEEYYEGEKLTREELVHEALYAAQDLRLYWLDHAPKPPQRRVGDLPGRNDPCPCGSGKKFKKCHGAQMQ